MSIVSGEGERACSGGRVYVLFSQGAQSGKTLFGRVLGEWIKLDRQFAVIDTQEEGSCLGPFFPRKARFVDLANVQAHVSLFDELVADHSRDYIIELPYHLCSHFFDSLSVVGPLARSLTVVGFYVFQGQEKGGVKFLRNVRNSCPDLRIINVRNHWRVGAQSRFDGTLLKRRTAALEIVMPIINEAVWPVVQDRSFHFDLDVVSKIEFIDEYDIESVADWTRWIFRQLWECSLQVRMMDLWRN